MNRFILKQYIDQYVSDFNRINKMEIYKWRAVKQFQEAWNPDAADFPSMLKDALSKTDNLMSAGNYYPRATIIDLSDDDSDFIKDAFVELFDQEKDLLSRIEQFQSKIKQIHSKNYPDWNDFQDDRAVMVYLTLRYPDTYYFYKYRMFKQFCRKVEHQYDPKPGKKANVTQFLNVCELVKAELEKDNKLIGKHFKRLDDELYYDHSLNILTQDFIYAVARHLDSEDQREGGESARLTLKSPDFKKGKVDIQLEGKHVNFTSLQKKRTHVGNSGEEIVLKYEMVNLPKSLRNKVAHASVEEGDGLGYDILSFDENGEEKYIEVKTTTGDWFKSFFVTQHELERSLQEQDSFYLYRLFNLDVDDQKADYFIIRGDISEYCTDPTEYKIKLTPSDKPQVQSL